MPRCESLNKKRPLRLFECRAGRMVEVLDPHGPLDLLGLKLVLWQGTYAQMPGTWLGFADLADKLLATGEERVQQERQRAERLARRLEELGVDPDLA